jgi:hypothetical protein
MMLTADDTMRPMRTTVNIDDNLLARARQLASRSGRSLGAIIDDGLRVLLVERASSARGRVSLPTDGGSGLQSGVDLEDKEALAELLGDNRPPSDAAR